MEKKNIQLSDTVISGQAKLIISEYCVELYAIIIYGYLSAGRI